MDIHPSPPIASSSKHVPHQHSKKRRPSTSEDKNGGASRRREEGGEGRKRARRLPPPPFPHAQRISLNDISQDTPASDDHFVSGKVVDVRQWSQEKRVVTLFIADDSTPQPLKIFLKGSWVERAPKADGSRPSFAILLRGLKWETAGGIGGTRKYAAVFEEGAVFQLRDEVFDGFAAATKIATKQNQAPTGALKTTGPQSPSSLQVPPSTQVASSVAPPPASLHPPPAHARSTSPTNPSSAEISASAPPLQLPHSTSIPTKRPRSPSSPSPSSKRVAPSGLPAFPPSDSPIDEDTSHAPINSLPPPPKPTRAQAPTLEQPKSFVATPLPSPISPTKLPSFTLPGPPPPAQPSVTLPNAPSALPPHPHSPMRVIITTHVLKFDPHLVSDDQLLQRVVDGLIGLPETIWRELLLSDEGFASRFRQIKARLLQEAEEEEMREQREEAAKAASRVDATRRDEEGGGLGVVRVEKELVCQAVPGKESVVQQRVQGRPSDPSHQPLQLLHQPTLLASPPQAFSSTSNLATPSIPTGLSPLKLVAVQPHPDDAPGPSHSRHPQALQPPQSLRTSSQSQLPSPLPSSVEAAPSTISIPGPSRALPSDASMGPDVVGLPSVKGKKRERVSPFSRRAIFETESSERMVDRPEDEVSPTQSIFYDKQHPNGTSLLEILLTDRAKFRTRARIVDFAPKALEDVVVASCDRCDIDLPSSDKRCRNCNDITGHFTAWRYRLVFVLSDGTASLKAAVFDEEDMLTLFPNLPPASEFANSPTSPMEYLETQIEKLVGKMDSPSSTSTRREGPLLDLSLRKFRADVRGVPGIGKEGWAWSYRVFQTVIR